ncbi:hypothetical protein TeGR_g14848 [Tetraparma gracilis]|uniref:Nuclear nucleic acid-binding protein C1D n=1 Tax=Tetraparma gracilis TaxID=2962635 RepID=A0ABQ6NC18_9STRA|nr:hypothetical protein TeGR_g14848 [Tetraparma gracilis]
MPSVDDLDVAVESLKQTLDQLLSSPAALSLVSSLHSLLSSLGVPPSAHPTADQMALSLFCTVVTLVNYYLLFGGRHVSRRRALRQDLRRAAERVHELEEKLLALQAEEQAGKREEERGERPVR